MVLPAHWQMYPIEAPWKPRSANARSAPTISASTVFDRCGGIDVPLSPSCSDTWPDPYGSRSAPLFSREPYR
ncbi:hypothetical protein Shyhy02_08610 [Streptomyces hygroscopicus subsp. hygroscopicus]|nr:hypothetical protein Shyhy02_08610 [Streptomyces hygroscopicus subsp. hygroscopicus]